MRNTAGESAGIAGDLPTCLGKYRALTRQQSDIEAKRLLLLERMVGLSSMRQVAAHIGVAPSTVSRWLKPKEGL